MLVTARARLLTLNKEPILESLALDIIKEARSCTQTRGREDPLCYWFTSTSATILRRVKMAIHRLLIERNSCGEVLSSRGLNNISCLAAFYYVALFRTVRQLLTPFFPSNPTWIKRPDHMSKRLRPRVDKIRELFLSNIKAMINALREEPNYVPVQQRKVSIVSGDSAKLSLPDDSVDFFLSSPPYCTRIDYAMATMPELAILGYDLDSSFQKLRRRLIGSTTVPSDVEPPALEWGLECNTFLENVANHPSKASRTYYYKNHVEYFGRMFQSLKEVARVLRPDSRCVIVAQDSYYKNVRNNLPFILQEMLEGLGMISEQPIHFPNRRIMSNINGQSRHYRNRPKAVETVILMRKKNRLGGVRGKRS